MIRILSIVLLCICPSVSPAHEDSAECPIIGIKYGLTNICVGVFKRGQVEIIPNEFGSKLTPSVVGAFLNDKKLLPFQKGEQEVFSPEEISSIVLRKMKFMAQTYTGKEIRNAIITVPVHYDNLERQSIKKAGILAGLNVVRVISEPIAAAIAYGLDSMEDKRILVYDLGSRSFSASILTIDDGVFEIVQEINDQNLGGRSFDDKVVDFFVDLVRERDGIELTYNKQVIFRLRKQVEKAKILLSSQFEVEVQIEQLLEGYGFKETLTRSKFQKINSDSFQKTIQHVKAVLKKANMTKNQIDHILLIGGSSNIPKIQYLVREFFDGKDINLSIKPEEAICYGVAVQGGVICGDLYVCELAIIDSIPLGLGIQYPEGIMATVIKRGNYLPTRKSIVVKYEEIDKKSFRVRIFEGQRPLTKDNRFLKEFNLTGVKGSDQGDSQIEVIFEMYQNYTLRVTAVDKGQGKNASIAFDYEQNMFDQPKILKILQQAQKQWAQDEIIKAKINNKQINDQLIE